ncbi:hypothetical protein BJ546DRAFT_418667 [Cryomyces antarcticus]
MIRACSFSGRVSDTSMTKSHFEHLFCQSLIAIALTVVLVVDACVDCAGVRGRAAHPEHHLSLTSSTPNSPYEALQPKHTAICASHSRRPTVSRPHGQSLRHRHRHRHRHGRSRDTLIRLPSPHSPPFHPHPYPCVTRLLPRALRRRAAWVPGAAAVTRGIGWAVRGRGIAGWGGREKRVLDVRCRCHGLRFQRWVVHARGRARVRCPRFP